MNIREAIAAGDLDDSVKIETTVGETSDYGRACNQAGYMNGLVKGFGRGALIACTGITVGLLAGMAMTIISDIRSDKNKED